MSTHVPLRPVGCNGTWARLRSLRGRGRVGAKRSERGSGTVGRPNRGALCIVDDEAFLSTARAPSRLPRRITCCVRATGFAP